MFERGQAVLEQMLGQDREIVPADSPEIEAAKDCEPFVVTNDTSAPRQLENGEWLMPGQSMVVKAFPEGTSNSDMADWVKSKEQAATKPNLGSRERLKKVGQWAILGFVVPLGIFGTLNGHDYNPTDYVNNVSAGVHDVASVGEHMMDFAKFVGGLMP